MKQVITIIYFTDNAGKAHTIEFSLKSLVLLATGFFVLMLVLIASAAFSLKLYVEKDRLAHELASVAAKKNSAPPPGLAANLQTKDKSADSDTVGGNEPLVLHGFQVKKERNGLKIGFDLVNANNNGKSLNGYVFIVGDYGGKYFSFPEGMDIKDGIPVDFKKGDRFAIKRQKRLEQIFPYSMDNIIKTINVFVFSAEGNLLVKKEAAL